MAYYREFTITGGLLGQVLHKEHLHAFLMVYDFVKRLQPLRGLTPYAYSCQCWQKESERLTTNPYHHTLGLNI
jgi:hypothetical protein